VGRTTGGGGLDNGDEHEGGESGDDERAEGLVGEHVVRVWS